MRKTNLIFLILSIMALCLPVNVYAKESREQLLESALLNRYYPLLWQSAKSQFDCQSIVSIKRLGAENEVIPQFEVKVQLLTFQGAHNPPHDLITIIIEDTLTEAKIMNVKRIQNVSPEVARETCDTSQTKVQSVLKPTEDSEQLRLQDMLMNMLAPYIQKDLQSYYYPKILKDFSPSVDPWKIEVIETRRVNGFRGFILNITFDIEPTDGGHHVPVGKDRMTYRISFGPEVKLMNHTHLETYKYPPE